MTLSGYQSRLIINDCYPILFGHSRAPPDAQEAIAAAPASSSRPAEEEAMEASEDAHCSQCVGGVSAGPCEGGHHDPTSAEDHWMCAWRSTPSPCCLAGQLSLPVREIYPSGCGQRVWVPPSSGPKRGGYRWAPIRCAPPAPGRLPSCGRMWACQFFVAVVRSRTLSNRHTNVAIMMMSSLTSRCKGSGHEGASLPWCVDAMRALRVRWSCRLAACRQTSVD